MRKRLVFTSIGVVFLARYYLHHAPEGSPQLPLPDAVTAFLISHNLANANQTEEKTGSRPGKQAGIAARRHPVVIVPGIVSCGLEVWQAKPCLGDKFFRRRLWGHVSMVEAILQNLTCWMEHLALDPVTGLDPEGIRLRVAKGLHGADYFVSNFWLWAKLIQNLADVGYDDEEILMACHDWRLAYPNHEARDKRFSKLRRDIEGLLEHTGEKAVVIAHSMGANLWIYFMNWVEDASPGWVEKHIATFINAAGAVLGAIGPLAAFLSGEMQATAETGPLGPYIEMMAMTWDKAREVYWTMGGLGSLLPMGGSTVWGSSKSGFTDSPVDTVMLETKPTDTPQSLEDLYGHVENREDLPLRQYKAWASYDRGLHPPGKAGLDGPVDPKRWANPVASPLPKAPSMRIHCLYGHGIPTERAYRYAFRQVRWSWADGGNRPTIWSSSKGIEETIAELKKYVSTADEERPVQADALGSPLWYYSVNASILGLEELSNSPERPEDWFRVDRNFHSNDTAGPWNNSVDGIYSYGVAASDGDGTVPLVSLAYMCSHGWREPDFGFNPAGIEVWTKEYKHDPSPAYVDPRGGPASSKHVDILGNTDFITDILAIATEQAGYLRKDFITSNITEIGPRITERIRKFL
mmetsp:Transcript_63462/g.138216  ORF Transcript_63462/g.138216 Transcript_63462/m.138216 type:complete len:635 (+) Transcript_63462:82-1986(+)